MAPDENLNPELQLDIVTQILKAAKDPEVARAFSSAISSAHPRTGRSYNQGYGYSQEGELQGSSPVQSQGDMLYSDNRKSAFDTKLLWISGPGTNNLVLSFFLSNPRAKYSREDVFAHLNRECEEQGIAKFFSADWGMNWDFSLSSKDVKNKSGLKIGRSTILRVVENLKNLGLLKGLPNGKYRLELRSPKVRALQNMIQQYPWQEDESYEDFMHDIDESLRTRKTYYHLENLEDLVRHYVGELEYLSDKNREHFRSKLSRLSHYCEYEEDESYSSVSRQLIGNKKENNLIIKILHGREWDNARLRKICVNIGHENNPALSRKTKNNLIDYIAKNSP